MKINKGLVLILLLLFSPCRLYASDLDLERGLQEDLFRSLSIIEKALEKMQEGSPLTNETTRLKSRAESITASHMLLQERFRARSDHVATVGPEANERQNMMSGSYSQAVEEYLSILENSLQNENISEKTLDALRRLLKKILHRKKPLIFGTLPYKTLNYPAQQPVEQPSITPAYQGGDKTVSTADVEGAPEAPITEEISTLAESLEWNPVLIYEWVKNNVETEWYWGCMKGAEETLRQKSGNDSDQAALLIALLRASGFPSRYVRGVIEFFPGIEIAKNLTGIQEPQGIAEFFRKAGIPHKLVIEGGKIANFQIEHIWVESRIPFANFHGAVVDEHGKAWLGLDTSIKVKGYIYNQPFEILEEYPISNIRDEYLSTLRDLTPLEYIRTDIEAYLELNYPDLTYEDLLKTKALAPESMDILPASLQFKQVVITNEYTALPDELIHKVRFSTSDPNNNDLFDITLETLRLSNQLVAVTYEPETVEDQAVINSFGGLGNTPAYLVRLRPTLQLNGQNIVVATGGLPLGAEYDLGIELISPSGSETITNTHITGNYAVIGIVAEKAVALQTNPDEGKDAWRILHKEAINYIYRWNQAEEALASLMNLSIARPIPTVVTLGGVIDITYLLDTPHGFEWRGVYIDADLRAIETATSNAQSDDRQKEFMELSSLQGSFLENRILEDDFQVDSVSTAKVFQLANDNQIPILTIDTDNIDDVLPTLPFAEEIKDDISNAIHQNLVVKIPQSEISYQNWTGIGYIKDDPVSGASGWMLSGTIAGGMTAGTWSEDLLSIFSSPYSKPSNENPTSAFYIFKVSDTDMQKGTAGEKLAKPLTVMVFDKDGNPVKGADVSFTVKSGGGQLYPGRTIKTDAKGMAAVELTLGQKTGDNPTYMKTSAQSLYHQQVGENIVDASLDVIGESIKKPFTAYGFPKNPVNLRKIFGDLFYGEILSFSGFVSVIVEDMYGNPISNIPVDFTALTPIEQVTCSNPNQDTRPALLIQQNDPCILAVYPTWGECATASAQIQEITDILGTASAHILLGGIPSAEYPIEARYQTLTTTFQRFSNPFGDCDQANAAPAIALRVEYLYPADSFGANINGVETGSRIPVMARLFYQYEEEAEGTDCGGQCPKVVGARQYGMDTNFEDASVTVSNQPCTPLGEGIFECEYRVGSGLNTITFNGTATVNRHKYDNACPNCGPRIEVPITQNASTTMGIFGVDVLLNLGPEDYIFVDDLGYTLKDYTLTSAILPYEYKAETAYVVIKKDGQVYQYIKTGDSQESVVTLLKGYYFDTASTYTAQVVLNVGRVASHGSLEIWSQEIPLQVISTGVSAQDVKLTTYVDRINGDICASPGHLEFTLSDDALVTIEVDGSVIEQTVGSQTIPLENIPYTAGLHQVLITRDMVPLPGEHAFQITAVFRENDPRIESTATGKIIHNVVINEFLPIGHTFVKGIDINDGHVSLTRQDISIPGVGPSLNFSRSYGSTGNSKKGPMGAGWTHSYNSRLDVDSCDRIIVKGGEGNGTRFSNPVADQDGLVYQPQAGYHGKLVYHGQSDSYDYYTKTMIHYHFELSPDPEESKPNGSKEYTLRFIEDLNGNRLTLVYDSSAPYNLLSVQDASGRVLQFEYTENNTRIRKVVGPLGLEVTFDYDKHGNLTGAKRNERQETYQYTTDHARDKHNLRRVVDPEGNATEYVYYTEQESILGYPDDFNWTQHILIFPEKYEYVKTVIEASGTTEAVTTQFTYDYLGNTRTVTGPKGDDFIYTLNSYGSAIETEDPLGNKTLAKWAMDVGINDVYIVERTDAEGNKALFEYDINGNLIKSTDALGNFSTVVYDMTWNKPLTTVDANNHTTHYAYDSNGNLVEMTDPLGNRISYTYNTLGLKETETNANEETKTFTYDEYGNTASVEDPEGGIERSLCDARSRLLQSTDQNGHQMLYEYDELDRTIKQTDDLGHSIIFAFDNNGNKTSKTDQNGHTTTYTYDSLNRLVTEIDPLGKSIRYQYDENSNKAKAIDKNGHATTYVYDALNRLVKKINADAKEMTYSYDNVGNKTSEVDYSGHRTDYAYDASYWLIAVTDSLGHTTAYEYDAVGNKTKETDPNGHETVFIYDAANRLLTRTDAMGNVNTFEYDGAGNVVRETDGNGHATTYTYDGNDRRIEETDPLGNVVSYEYDAKGNKTKAIDQNGHESSFSYDALDRQVSSTDAGGNSSTVEYDPPGNKIRETDKNGHITQYAYDANNRLTSITDHLGNAIAYEYDSVGNKTEETDPNSHKTVFVYDALNRVVSQIDAKGNASTISYDAVSNKIKETDRNGHATFYTYDSEYRLVSVKDHLDYTATYTYDNAGNRLSETDQNGHNISYEYDALNRPTKKTDPLGFVTELSYDAVGNVINARDARGNDRIRAFDAVNRLIKETMIDSSTGSPVETTYTYDAAGNKLTETNGRGFTSNFAYDSLNRLVLVTDPLGQSVFYEYDAKGSKTRETDKRGIVSTYEYDELDRILNTTRAGVTTRSYQYDAVGNKTLETDARGNTTDYKYDELNRLVEQTTPLNGITSYTYDNEGNKLTEVDPEGHFTVSTYDELNRLTSISDQEGNITRYEYDGVGNKTKLIEPNGNDWSSQYHYDPNNRLVRIIDAFGNATGYTYDASGNRVTQTDGNANITTFEYDSLNRQTGMVQYHTGGNRITEFSYDNTNNRTKLIDPKGQEINFTYDALDRLTEKSYPSLPDPVYPAIQSISFSYDENNNETRIDEQKVTSSAGDTITETTLKVYDSFDRLTSVTDRDNKTIAYTYDAAGNRTSVTDPDSNVATYTYDERNRLSTALTQDGLTQYTFYADDMQKEIIYPNNTRAEFEYDNANRSTRIANSGDSGTISMYVYTYDNNGNRLTMEETQGSTTEKTDYVYVYKNQLSSVNYPVDDQYPAGRQVDYTYDHVGNRIAELETDHNSQVLLSKAYTYDDLNQLVAITDNLGSENVSFDYDNNGNTISRTKGGTTINYRYDVKDYLRIVDNGSSDLAVFDYNYYGMRVTKSGNDGEVRFVYDEKAVLLETDANGSTVAKYAYGDNLLSLSHADQGIQFYLFAGLGSVSNLTNADGSVRCSYKYDAWGNFRNNCNASWNKKTFTGKEWDEETGLYYFGARFYDPEVGRFITQDPYLGDMNTPPSLHRYLYAYANPTVYVDLFGYDSLRWEIDQAATRAARQGGFLGITKLVGLVAGQTLYKAANVITFGWIDKHDDARDAYDRRKIGYLDYVEQSGKAGVKSASLIAATAITGGTGAFLAKGLGATAQVVVGGASAGIGAQAVEDAWRGKRSSGGTYLRAALMGGALSWGGSKALKLKNLLGDAGVREGLQKLRWAARRPVKSPTRGGEIVGASWHETVKQPPLKQRALNQVREKAKAAASWVSNVPGGIRNLPANIRALPRRLSIMSRMDPGAGTYKRILEIEKGVSVVPGERYISGAKYRGTEGLSHAEVYEFMRDVSNRGFGRFMWSKAEMHTRVLFQRARNLAQNLLTREAVRPVRKGLGDPYLKGDYDVISNAPEFQGQKGDFVRERYDYARRGNEAAGLELFDVYTSKPYPHGILPKKLPGNFLIEDLPGKSFQTIDLFRKGGRIKKASKGDPWVDARFVIKMTK